MTDTDNSTLVIAMPFFKNGSYELMRVLEDLKTHWDLDIDEINGDDEVATFNADGIMVAIGAMPAPIPNESLEPLLQYSYLYPNAEEVLTHTSHAIVSIMNAPNKLSAHILLTMVNASILRTTQNAMGVYQGSATLLLPKGLYCDFADFLLEDRLPVILWIFIGIIHHENSRSLYTFGLKEFGRMELEILESPMLASELHDFILPTLAYLLSYDVHLQDGETIGFSEDHKIAISQSAGVYLEGDTLKLAL